jgi:hypothetical protein
MTVLILSTPTIYAGSIYNTIEHKVNTYAIRLQTAEGRWLTDSVSAPSENDAKYIIYQRYPNCTVYSIRKIG